MTPPSSLCRAAVAAGLFFACLTALHARTDPPRQRPRGAQRVPSQPPLIGRWDLTVRTADGEYPSWLEVERSGTKTLVGYFVHRGGSVRPISHVRLTGDQFECSFPVQWESGPNDLRLEGRVSGDGLNGTLTDDNGKRLPFTGLRAPALKRDGEPQWGETVPLFNGKDLSGWRPRHEGKPSGWVVENGLLRNKRPQNDLVTTQKFRDFKLHAEFRYPRGSNSGIYLRGRYEVQIEDNYGRDPESHLIGGVYGFLTPRVNAAKPAGEWQSFDLTLVGRRVTVVHNGETVIDRAEIPGITGGALDSREGEPGPIFLQGDHGPIDFRALTITPGR